MSGLLSELKRRNVFRVAVAYGVVGWLLVQITLAAVPAFGMPGWMNTVVFYLVLLGFPLALIFSWAFEMTPEGVKKTAEVDAGQSITHNTGHRIDRLIMGALVLLVGFLLVDRFTGPGENTAEPETSAITRIASASIAVLPFIDLSPEGDQEYFSDGISEELLNVLAQIPEFRVAARTSSFQFKGRNVDIPLVAQQLNVGHVLEGSVRKAGDQIRITAQLIDASNGFHLWSETYDRKLENIFAIQDEISAAIVTALKTELGLEVEAPAPVTAAANSEAYNYHLQGQYLLRQRTVQSIEAAIPNFESAIKGDPEFAPAYAGLGLAWYLLLRSGLTYGDLDLDEALAHAQPNVERALALDPDLAEGHGLMGLILSARGRLSEALAAYEKALALNPSLSQVRNWYASGLRAAGRPEESFEQYRLAYEADPLSRLTLYNYINLLVERRRFEEAAAPLARLRQIAPAGAHEFTGNILWAQNRPADAIAEYLKGLEIDPGNSRLQRNLAFSLLVLGFDEEFRRLYPFADMDWQYLNAIEYSDEALQMARARYSEKPDEPGRILDLAFHELFAGNDAHAAELARQELARLAEADRPRSPSWWVLAYLAYKDNNFDQARDYLAPLHADWVAQFASGIDNAQLNTTEALFQTMVGNRQGAVDYLARAMTMGNFGGILQEIGFAFLGWQDMPEMVALREENGRLIAAEHKKLLLMACGDEAFAAWTPLPETCAELP